MLLVLILAVGIEAGQATGVVLGTFDYYDLFSIVAAFAAAQILAVMHSKSPAFARVST
jgi:hypothetical protein